MTTQNGFIVVVPFCCTGMWVSAHRILSNSFTIYEKAVFLLTVPHFYHPQNLSNSPILSQGGWICWQACGFRHIHILSNAYNFYKIAVFGDRSTLLPLPVPPKILQILPYPPKPSYTQLSHIAVFGDSSTLCQAIGSPIQAIAIFCEASPSPCQAKPVHYQAIPSPSQAIPSPWQANC